MLIPCFFLLVSELSFLCYTTRTTSWLSAEVAIYLSIFITVLSHLCSSMLPFTDEEDDSDEEFGSASKRRRRSVKVKKSNKYV